jgi:hypothetical protein
LVPVESSSTHRWVPVAVLLLVAGGIGFLYVARRR